MFRRFWRQRERGGVTGLGQGPPKAETEIGTDPVECEG